MGVKIVVDKLPEILAALKAMRQKEVLIGISGDSPANQRAPEPGEKGEPINNAALGYIMETGAPEANIPARPFLIPGVEGVVDKIAETMRAAASATLDGKLKAAEEGLVAVGLMAAAAVQRKITDGPFQPLAPRTLEARAARGVTRTNPLIDTGSMKQAITYAIADKGKKD